MSTEITEYVIEMLWDCPNKHKGQLGRHLNCQVCGYRKKEDQEYYKPADTSLANKIEGEIHEKQAAAGPNWSCKYCGCTTRNTSGNCSFCGGEKPVKKAAAPTKPAPKPQTDSDDADDDIVEKLNKPSFVEKGLLILGAIILLAIFGYALADCMRPTVGVLTAVHVSCEQVLEEYVEVADNGFSAPLGAYDVQDDGLKFHHNDRRLSGSHIEDHTDSVACGQTCQDIPRTCRSIPKSCSSQCTSAKNGYAKCRQVCSGGGQSCSGGGQSCRTKYCSVVRHETVNDYTNVPVFLPSYRWKKMIWRQKDKPSTPLAACSDSCTDESSALQRKIHSTKVQTATLNVKGQPKDIKLRSCQELKLGTTYSTKGAINVDLEEVK